MLCVMHPCCSTACVSPCCRTTTVWIDLLLLAGEYAMLKAAALNGWLNEEDAVLEALLGMRRAGAELILSYYATDAAKWMNK